MNTVQNVLDIDAQISKVESMQKDSQYSDDASQEKLKTIMEGLTKQRDFAKSEMKNAFEAGIGQMQGYIEMLESFETVPDLMNWLVCDCDFIGSKSEAIKYVLTEWNLSDDECDPLDSEWVNRIGDVYIIISEY